MCYFKLLYQHVIEMDIVSSRVDLNDDDLILVEADKPVELEKQVEPVKVEVPLTGENNDLIITFILV